MILSGRDISWYIETGHLAIAPIQAEQFTQNGVDLILEELTSLAAETPVKTLAPGRAYLGSTRECLRIPDDLMGFVELRSTWARQGLFLPPTIVDAGFEGTLTLEIFYAGPRPLPVPLGRRFAHLVLARLSTAAVPYAGKYQHQRGITRALPDPAPPTPGRNPGPGPSSPDRARRPGPRRARTQAVHRGDEPARENRGVREQETRTRMP